MVDSTPPQVSRSNTSSYIYSATLHEHDKNRDYRYQEFDYNVALLFLAFSVVTSILFPDISLTFDKVNRVFSIAS